jgi:Domain of unknown function (DUF4386)
MSTPLSESRKRRVHSAGERVVLDALACTGTAVALFSVVKRQHVGFALGFVTTRMFEAAVIVIGVVSIMAVVTLRQTAAEADAASLVAVGGARAPSVMPLSCWGRPDSGLQRRVAGLPDVPVWTRAASHSGDGAHRSSAAHLVHARNEARRQGEGVRMGGRRTAPIFFWELSLHLWMTFKGFNPSSPILATRSAEWGSPATS